MKKITVCDISVYEYYDEENIPTNLLKFMEWVGAKAALIPDEHIETATIEIDACDVYGDPSANLIITYKRPYTEEEKEAMRLEVEASTRKKEEAERKRYFELKRKFEANP